MNAVFTAWCSSWGFGLHFLPLHKNEAILLWRGGRILTSSQLCSLTLSNSLAQQRKLWLPISAKSGR